MKLLVVFLLTALLPIVCFGIKCKACASPMTVECEKQPLVENECIYNLSGDETEEDLQEIRNATYWCSISSINVVNKQTKKKSTVFYRDCFPKGLKGHPTKSGCYDIKYAARPPARSFPAASFQLAIKTVYADEGRFCFCDTDLCNKGKFPKPPPIAVEVGVIKSISLVSWIITGFLSLAYLMPWLLR